ncbi:hypothetical protein FAUST_3078 [Fusarium austroamericanum]|uniref:Uncharacterized protein n=1 Tax=Fusarium austroamericanum TaxID=282268 RepID=A0AAN6C5Y0_FUSAU|nr:hypothetical protein FAUST_3078 [Fusarium austroamericanum]
MSTLDGMKEAAKAFSRILTENNIEHAFIGGFALQMLGNVRETFDIDVEVGVNGNEELRGSVPILEPGVLILTKMKRAAQYIGSKRPQSMLEYSGDLQDILHLLAWLRDHNSKIDFFRWARLGQSNNVEMLDSALNPSDKAKLE